MRSLPASATGSVSSWIAKVCTMPTSASAATMSGLMSKSLKAGLSERTGARAASGAGVSSGCAVELSVICILVGCADRSRSPGDACDLTEGGLPGGAGQRAIHMVLLMVPSRPGYPADVPDDAAVEPAAEVAVEPAVGAAVGAAVMPAI